MALPHLGQGAAICGRRSQPLHPGGDFCPLQREGVMPMYVTYAELFSFCLVILGVIGVVLNAKKK